MDVCPASQEAAPTATAGTPTPHSIAPVILLTDPAFRDVITPRRARLVVLTPRGRAYWWE
ncbi:hypothetical protein GCM10010300_41760 [Streptomyces olivaceoviridis]|nr:hypothetical protein GCM10010300_41760 [Streptomyces olivaceoviridis]